ncbi:hypothetical protein [Acinetobacter junii]|uniref:hypothetical protein n=1 Tax=Acinetobacter junii TaxID=40215 RepID=UPI003018ADAA
MTKDIEREAFEEFYKTQILTKDYEIEMIDQLTEFHVETGLYEYARMQTAWQSWQAAKAHEAEKLKGKVVVPVEPTEDQWGGLARVLGRYMQNKDRYCPKTLKLHLDMFADSIPEWLNKEVKDWDSDHAFATADLPVFIYKSMLEAARGGNE